MATVPMAHTLLLAGTLFALGLTGLPVRHKILFILMSLEVMLNATGLSFVPAGARWEQANNQVVLFLSYPWRRQRPRWVWRSCSKSTTA